MKINIIDENNFVIFLNKFLCKEINLDDQDNLEDNLRNIFTKLKERYKMDVNGYYNITVYQDNYYGAVFEIEKEEINYFDYDIDMHLNIKKTPILYEIDDIFNFIDKKIYLYKNRYYLKLENDCNDFELGRITENSRLTYGLIVDEILRYGKVISI